MTVASEVLKKQPGSAKPMRSLPKRSLPKPSPRSSPKPSPRKASPGKSSSPVVKDGYGIRGKKLKGKYKIYKERRDTSGSL